MKNENEMHQIQNELRPLRAPKEKRRATNTEDPPAQLPKVITSGTNQYLSDLDASVELERKSGLCPALRNSGLDSRI